MEQFEQIRRDHEHEGLSIRELARRHGVHRRAVHQALAAAQPPPRKAPEGRPAPKLGPYRGLIDEWLIADRSAPPKQRHTARRVWQRLVEEHGAEVAEVTVRQHVHARRRALGLVRLGMVPQLHHPGAEAEVDWGQAKVYLAGRLVEVHLFHMRACASGGSFVVPYPAETQSAFLEAHVQAFDFFGGVFSLVRYDNLRLAVQRVLRGRRRIEQERFVGFRSHYLYQSAFTLAGIEGAHEKGGVEGEVGRFRRRHLVPVPAVDSFSDLTELIAGGVARDAMRHIGGRPESVGEALVAERQVLRALPAEPYPWGEQSRVRVSDKSLVTVRQNHYSVPVRLIGMHVLATAGAREVAVHHQGREVARHERVYGRLATHARLDHYLDLLRTKPGALAGSLALSQERERGAWPGVYDELWAAIAARYGRSQAARQMVDVLLLAREVGPEALERAVAGALGAGAHDGRAVALLARRGERPPPAALADLPQRLLATARPEPGLVEYDRMLGARA